MKHSLWDSQQKKLIFSEKRAKSGNFFQTSIFIKNDNSKALLTWNFNFVLIYTKNSELLGKKWSKLAFLGKMPKMSISAPRLPPKVPPKGQLFWNDIITSIFTSYFNIILIHTKNSDLLGEKRSKLAFLGKMTFIC